MLEAGKRRLRVRADIVHDFDDRRYRLAHLAEKFEAHGANMRRHPVQDERRFGDDAVAAFFLHAGEPAQELVGDILAEPALAETGAGYFQDFLRQSRPAVQRVARDAKARERDVMNLAEVVLEPFHIHPLGVRRHHAPAREIVERRAPQHRFLAAGIHRHVAADTRGVG